MSTCLLISILVPYYNDVINCGNASQSLLYQRSEISEINMIHDGSTPLLYKFVSILLDNTNAIGLREVELFL